MTEHPFIEAAFGRPGRQVVVWSCAASAVLLAGWVLSQTAVSARGRDGRYLECKYNLRDIELALHNYHHEHGSFPPAVTYGPEGKPWHSWRTLLLRYLDQPALAKGYRLDEPWDGPHNKAFLAKQRMPSVFDCPNDPTAGKTTSYLAVVGDGTMWPDQGAGRLDDVPDGPGRTVHVVETAASGVHWAEPADLRLDTMAFAVNPSWGTGIRSRHAGIRGTFQDGPPRVNVAFADGEVRPLHPDMPPETLKSLILKNDGGPEDVP